VLEELWLLAEGIGVTLPSGGKPALAAVRCIGRSLLSLLVVEGVGEVYPEAAVSPQGPPDLVEDMQQVADEVVRVWLVPQFTLPPVRPSRHGSVPTQEIEGW